MHENIFAYTALDVTYPEYLSINREDDGSTSVTVRGPAQVGSDLTCGYAVSMTLPNDQIGELIAALQEHRASSTPPSTPLPYADFPRRACMTHMVPAELAIRDAVISVEKAGAHPLLTDAVTLLDQAQQKVADFVDLAPAPLTLDHIKKLAEDPRVQQAVNLEGGGRFA